MIFFSEAVLIGLPYGSATAKKSTGEKVTFDNTLRLQRNQHITDLYKKYLEGIDREDLAISRSSQWEILNICSATKKKAIQGLDDFIAHGRDVSETDVSLSVKFSSHFAIVDFFPYNMLLYPGSTKESREP
jgi:hypothetical protein